MGNVTPIRPLGPLAKPEVVFEEPLQPDAEKALELMEEARRLLTGLVERGEVAEGSPPDATRCYLDDAIGMLRPLEEMPHG